MTQFRPGARRPVQVLAALALLTACATPRVATVPPPESDTVYARVAEGRQYPDSVLVAPIRLLPCPGGTGTRVSRSVPPSGDRVEHPSGHSLRVGGGVVGQETEFHILEIRHERHLRIEVWSNDGRQVEGDLELTISLRRCPPPQTGGRPLRILRLNPDGLADDLEGDVAGDSIRARLDRLSVFAVGF